jgi:wolfamin
MNCRGMLYLIIPVFMFLLARRRQWHGIIQFLIPHCVTLSWLQITIISSQSATTFGLVRSALGLAGVLLFLPLFGLVTLLIPVFAAVEWLSLTDTTNRIFVTISTSIVAIIGSCFMAISNRTGKYVTVVQITLCIIASCLLFKPFMFVNDTSLYSSYIQTSDAARKNTESERILDVIEDDSSILNWELYRKYCLDEIQQTNRIKTQIRCSHLDGSYVHWEGSVNQVSISSVKNWRKSFIENYLPNFIYRSVICLFGDLNEANCSENENCEIKEFIENNKKCNLDKWNTYEYEIDVNIGFSKGFLNSKTDSIVKIVTEHAFGNFTREISIDDRIWFRGNLKTSITEKVTKIDLESIGCLKCVKKSLASVSIKNTLRMENKLKDLRRAFKYLLNVIFNPLVTFK